MKYFLVHVHNNSSHVSREISDNGMGGVLEAGTFYFLNYRVCLDAFISYSFKRLGAPHSSRPNVRTHSLEVGGLNVGGGMGVQF